MIELLHSAHALPAEVAHERARGGQLFAGRLKKEKDDECRLEREAERATTSKRNEKKQRVGMCKTMAVEGSRG